MEFIQLLVNAKDDIYLRQLVVSIAIVLNHYLIVCIVTIFLVWPESCQIRFSLQL